MSTTTINYELIKPELTDSANITAMNPNWDKIDTELKKKYDADNKPTASDVGAPTIAEHTQLKSEFTEQKGQAIYATDLLAPYPVPTFVRWDGNTKNTPFTDGMVLNQDGFAFVQGDDYFHTVIAFTQGADNTRYWLNHTIDNGINRGWKNMTRELTEGTTLNDGWGMLNSFPYNTHILHRANNKDFRTWTEFVVQYPNEHNGASVAELLMLNQVTNDVPNWYHVYGEHNKPSGSYTGNGSATQRTVAVGGIGEVLTITSDVGMALVTNRGAICLNRQTGVISGLKSYEVNYQGGVLTIATANTFVNGNPTAYWYQVL